MTSQPATAWGAGDYPEMARRLRRAAKRVVERARIAPEERVIDIACGTGNAALLAAARGADHVVGVDLEPALLDVARLEAAGAGAEIEWLVGDAAALPVSGPFDAVLSVFGVMYAPDQQAAARELARVCAPDSGRVVLASWTPGSFMPAFGAAVAPFLPSPPAASPPSAWGDEAEVRALLGGAGLGIVSAEQESLVLTAPDRMHATAFLLKTAGNVLAERARIERAGRWGALLAAVSGLVAEHDSGVGENVALRCDYLLVEASPRS